LEHLPNGIVFKNTGGVNLKSLKNLPPDVNFSNKRGINLNSIRTIPKEIQFTNGGMIWLKSIIKEGYFNKWTGNIDEILWKRLLNKMISEGLFDRK
jgi:hypothetical protein